MVEFGTGYSQPMDREYGRSSIVDNSTNDTGIGIKDIGFSTGLGPTPNIPAVSAKMRAGMKKMELTFMGTGKGSAQGHTPGMYGERQRQALRELQEANKYNFTTHSSVGIMGLAGMDQQGNFLKQNKDRSINEIKRAIDFAADVGRGGPVVIHTGEYLRHIIDAPWNSEGKYKDKFQMFEGEEEQAAYRVVDTRTGRLIQEARKNRKVSRPVWNVVQKGQEFIDFDHQKKIAADSYDKNKIPIYVDYFGNRLHPESRVPKFDSENQRFETTQMGWDDLKKEAQEMTARAREFVEGYNKRKITEQKFKESYWYRFKDTPLDQIEVKPEEAYIIATLETNAATARGYASYYGGDFEKFVSDIKKLEKAREFYVRLETETDEKEKWKLKQQARALAGGLVPEEAKLPTAIIDEELKQVRRQLMYSRESSSSQWAQAEQAIEDIRYIESANTYALKESYDAYAKAGITAMMKSNELEKKGLLKRPLAVAMENLFPESYGAHPDELIDLVKKSREKMTEMLTSSYKISPEKAKKEAEEHIYATFDTAHCGLWWKYWKGDKSKTLEDNKKEFDTWMKSKIEELAKEKIVGHLHLVDTYGYEDEHLAPGEGNMPIKDIVKIFKKYGFKGDLVVEPGADFSTDTSGTQTLLKAWQHFGSPIYGTSSGASFGQRNWKQVSYGYFGQNQPPYFVFGPYSPSEDWSLWSGVPLE